jgi:hypothetical protein
LHILLKRKTQVIVFPLAKRCAVAIGTFAIIPTCKLKSHILITNGRNSRSVPAPGCGIAVISGNHNSQINAKIVMLKDRFLIQDVATFLNLALIHPDLNAEKGWFITLQMRRK